MIAIFSSKQRIHCFELLLWAGADFFVFHDISGMSWFLSFRSHKNQDIPEISWKIKKSAPTYNNNSKQCILCLEEKMAIITFPEQQKLLNKRSELMSKCRHENKFLSHYYDSKD